MILPDTDVCPECGDSFDGPGGLSVHWGHAHPDIPAPWWREKANATKGGQWWDLQRERVLVRDGYECQLCERRGFDRLSETLNVHHITPFDEIPAGEFPHKMENLVTLCKHCHFALEGFPAPLQEDILDP